MLQNHEHVVLKVQATSQAGAYWFHGSTSYFEHKWKWYQLQIFSEIDEAINNGM